MMASALARLADAALPPARFGLAPELPWSLLAVCRHWQLDEVTWRPPAALMGLYDANHAASVWHRIMDGMRQPAQVLEHQGCRFVQVLGLARIVSAPDGSFNVHLWRDSGTCLAWSPCPSAEIVLQALPAGWLWLDLIQRAVVVELAMLARRLPEPVATEDVEAYAASLFAWIRRRLVRHADLRLMRSKVRQALQLDPQAVRLAFRLIEGPEVRQPRLSTYEAALRHRDALLDLERVAPAAVPLYAVLASSPGFPRDLEPAAALRQHLASRGLQPSTWRLVAGAGLRLWRPVQDFYCGRPDVAMLDYLQILQMLRLKRAPAPWLAWCLLASVANPDQRYPQHAGQFISVQGALGHAAREFTGVSGDTSARDMLPLVIQWVSAERPRFDKPQRRAGWPWLVKQASAWAEAERRREDDRQWAVPVASHQAGDVQCTLIASERGLRLEGLEMRHCADLYVDRCASRRFVMASLVGTGPLQGRRATALFEREGMQWLVRQVRASTNREPGDALVEAAKSLAQAMEAVLSRKAERVEARYAPQVYISNLPPEGRCPKAMPPNAQLVCQLAWYWSPTSNLTMRYHLCRNRIGTHWVLWARMLDDDRGRWCAARACATLRWRGQTKAVAAALILEALWTQERDHRRLDHYSELSSDSVLCDEELENIADRVWDGSEGAEQ